MSLVKLNVEPYDGDKQSSHGSPDDRLPPQDVHAEQSVIGGMLISKDAIADCVEGLKGVDFYRPVHELIYDAILDLYGRGEPADAITVSDELNKRGDLIRVGGQAYLHQLISSVPTAANAGYYAEIVAERAVLRRLVDAGTKIVQMGYGQGGGDVVDIVNAAQAEIYAVADKRGGDDYAILGDVLEATVDEIEHASGRSGEMTGVPTGFTEFDNLTNGLHPGQMIVVAARPAVGKALALDTALPTPSGWTTMGEVAVGDLVLGGDGCQTMVTRATEVMTGRPCFEVEFSDGSVIVADADHQWLVTADYRQIVLTTVQLVGRLLTGQDVAISRDPSAGAPATCAATTWKLNAIRATKSVPVRCIEVDNEAHLYLAGESMIPTHNSTWGLDIARSAAIKHKMATVLFSLEMSRTEITMRLLSAEASIQLQNMRKGTMRDEDWTRLARTMGEVSDAPLFIDDSPNMSLMEIRAKCRRLKQRHNLRLVIIDYLQLMSSGKRVESRQQEVAEFSRALKLLAKELEVPVIAISQLNRGSEQRTDKRPQMSDLRESGCLTADTRILRADTGAETSMGELYAEGATDVPVWALDDSLRYVQRHLTHVFPTGVKPVFRLTLASGKTIRATENHPFLAYEGWTQLSDLRTGSRVAVPRHVPAPHQLTTWQDDQGVLLAHNLSCMARGSVAGPALGCFVPAALFHSPKCQIGFFLKHLWILEGAVCTDGDGSSGRIALTSQTRRLLDDVSRLLLRFGISCRIREAHNGFTLDVHGVDDQRRFLQEIDIHGDRTAEGLALLDIVRARSGNKSGAKTAPHVWSRVVEVMTSANVVPSPRRQGDARHQGEPQSLSQVVQVLDEADLDLDAVNDVLWDSVVSIEPDGVEEVYDATVLGTHNLIANGIAVHNSIEQDADMVILLHRESMYERESPREGEADLIVAKHRNGPTDTITVAFQGHYSRFTNMATNF